MPMLRLIWDISMQMESVLRPVMSQLYIGSGLGQMGEARLASLDWVTCICTATESPGTTEWL